jgi:hypothetical protein
VDRVAWWRRAWVLVLRVLGGPRGWRAQGGILGGWASKHTFGLSHPVKTDGPLGGCACQATMH